MVGTSTLTSETLHPARVLEESTRARKQGFKATLTHIKQRGGASK